MTARKRIGIVRPPDRARFRTILAAVAGARVAVVGDFCLDAYWFLDSAAAEASLETGLMTRPVRRQRYAPGGAGNVVRNLLALGVERAHAVGVIGDDPFGRHLGRLLTDPRLDGAGLAVRRGWVTPCYAKPVERGRETNRLDFGGSNRLRDAAADDLIRRLDRVLPVVRVVVINEQVAGGIHGSARFRLLLAERVRTWRDRIFLLDSRHYGEAYPGAWRKLNEREAARLCGLDGPIDEAGVRRAADTLWASGRRPVIVTRGARGCLVRDGRGCRALAGVPVRGPTDPVGAGDALLAGVAAALAAGCRLDEAAELGVRAAAVTVRKRFQAGTATPAELGVSAGSAPKTG